MNCREFLALLDAEPDALPPAAQAHVAACPVCAAALAHAEAVRHELRAMGEEEAPPFLAERVLARIRAERREASPRARRSWLLGPAPALTAAALLAGITLALLLRSTPEPVREAHSRQRLDKAVAPVEAPVSAADRAAAPAPPAAAPAPAAQAPSRANEETSQPARATVQTRAEVEADSADTFAEVPEAKADDEKREAFADAATVAPGAASAAPGVVGGIAASIDTRAAQEAPARPEVATEIMPASAPVQPRARAKVSASARATQGLAATAPADAPDGGRRELAKGGDPGFAMVVVELVPVAVGAGQARLLAVMESDAPPPGAAWTVAVSAERALVLLDAAGRDITAAHAGTLAALNGAALPPGRWRLSRP